MKAFLFSLCFLTFQAFTSLVIWFAGGRAGILAFSDELLLRLWCFRDLVLKFANKLKLSFV